MPQSYTPRGFAMYVEFEHGDYNDSTPSTFSVQQSSLATERKVWIGKGADRAHLNEEEARKVRDALTEFLLGGVEAGDGIIPDTPGDPHEAQRRNSHAVRYINQCAIVRVEPDKNRLRDILLGRGEG